jgi:hypothetical protein
MMAQNIHRITTHENYMIGVRNINIYSHMIKYIGEKPKVKIITRSFINISNDINTHLKTNYKDVIIDPEAEIQVIKQFDPSKYEYKNNIINIDDFMMYPFTKYLGIIMPFEIKSEDDNIVIYKCNIVDPVSDYMLFTRNHK